MTDTDDEARSNGMTWTTTYRIPIAIVSNLLTLLCCWALSTGDTAEKWGGELGGAVLIAWGFVF